MTTTTVVRFIDMSGRSLVVDVTELAGLAAPIRIELGEARAHVQQLMSEAHDPSLSIEARAGARHALRYARAHRDALRRLLLAVQTYVDVEGGV